MLIIHIVYIRDTLAGRQRCQNPFEFLLSKVLKKNLLLAAEKFFPFRAEPLKELSVQKRHKYNTVILQRHNARDGTENKANISG